MATLREEFTAHDLVAHCYGCAHAADFEAQRWASVYGWDVDVEWIRERLRCSRCGGRDCRLFRSGIYDADGSRRAARVALIEQYPGPPCTPPAAR